ncbi:EAL domain-containing protein [Hyphomicrobium sp. LHD-15]|uniref:EAL domain-containing protein n=1 Tax=Hyphomicrobium sp. LHD-15 TaxID=3072142 RepID=UPI00280E098E|nr:EAL domain-containing protein [Hyphomicrobium sp. LHD-15]MDQ8699714.1 EAL domain-containing protein [Hyphomicrobium sp. LHD-15]
MVQADALAYVPRTRSPFQSQAGETQADFLNRQLGRLALGPCRAGPERLLSCDFAGFALSSAFQPILDARNRTTYAHEALLRARDGVEQAVSPVEIFERISGAEDGRRLDRAARLIHVANFYAQTEPQSRLFLNVHGRHIEKRDVAHGEFFAAALAGQGLSASAITIEILESSIEDFDALGSAVESYKAFGFRVAIDDFGARHSNFDRVWRLNPDYVKIDRGLVVEAATNARARRVLPKIIEIVHDLDARVVCEGIEQEIHEQVAIDSGADFLQGYLYGRPNAAV